MPKKGPIKRREAGKPIGTKPSGKTAVIVRSGASVTVKTMPASEAESDGGFFALAGYVHQMLGTAADFARCLSGKAADAGGFETILCFETEAYGQDESVIGFTAEKQKKRVLTQYKYSADPEKNTIGPAKLEEIVKRLRASAAKANKTEKLETDLVLCTNRPLTSGARNTSAYKAIRYEQYEASKAKLELESYAAGFGTYTLDELNVGVQRAIQYLLQVATNPSTRLTQSAFEEYLIGHKQPRSLALPQAALARRVDLQQLGTESLNLTPSNLAERETLKGAIGDWTNDAIVVFVGDGGCGKTTALWHLLWEATDIASPQQLAGMMISQGQASESFGAVIERWRGAESGASSSPDDVALERIKHANPSVAPPIVLLGLDGIDETQSSIWRDTAARLLRFFWGLHVRAKTNGIAPFARLVVSCRERAEVERLLPSPTGAGVTWAAPRYVRFGQFEVGELIDVVERSAIDPPVADRILQWLSAKIEATEMDSGSLALSISSLGPSLPSLELLRHPIFWRSFCSLDAHAQNGFLDGSPEAQDQLGTAFLNWFCDRVHHRLRIETGYVPHALRRLADAFSDSALTHRCDEWMRCLQETVGYAEGQDHWNRRDHSGSQRRNALDRKAGHRRELHGIPARTGQASRHRLYR